MSAVEAGEIPAPVIQKIQKLLVRDPLADLNGGGMLEYREKKLILSGSPYEQHSSKEADRNAIGLLTSKTK